MRGCSIANPNSTSFVVAVNESQAKVQKQRGRVESLNCHFSGAGGFFQRCSLVLVWILKAIKLALYQGLSKLSVERPKFAIMSRATVSFISSE
jgi:hypothetical protein